MTDFELTRVLDNASGTTLVEARITKMVGMVYVSADEIVRGINNGY